MHGAAHWRLPLQRAPSPRPTPGGGGEAGGITQLLLGITQTHFPAERQALIISYAIPALDEYFADSSAREQDRILAFVQQQIDCASPKTRRLAKDFIKKWTG